MFNSLKTKIVVLIFIIMVVTASVIMFFTHRDVGRAILVREVDSAQNVLHFIMLNIKGGYDKLLSDKVNTIVKRKLELKNKGNIATSVVEDYAAFTENGLMPLSEAQDKFLKWFRSVSFEKGRFWFIFDHQGKIIAHTDIAKEGQSLNTVRDMKGRKIVGFQDSSGARYGGEYKVFLWDIAGNKQGSKFLGYFTYFPNWSWAIVTVSEIGNLENEIQKQQDKIIEVLSNTFSKIKIAKTGSVFLFTSKEKTIIPPVHGDPIDLHTTINLKTGHLLSKDLMAAAKSATQSIEYLTASDDGQPHQAHIQYFKALDWYITVSVPVSEIKAPAVALVMRQSILITVIFLGSLIAAVFFVQRISRPLNLLAEYAIELPHRDFTSTSEIDEESPIIQLTTRSKDEVGGLATALLFMTAELKRSIRNLMETTAAKERIEGELNVAREIQMGILPKTFPAFADRHEFDLFAMLEPAKEVGGDLYDFFFLDQDHLCFTVGDVSDKGVPAALFMVITRTLIKMSPDKDKSPADMLIRINDVLSTDNPNSMFVTLIVAILNVRTGHIRYANGGHNPPIVLSKNKKAFYKTGISGPVVGAMEHIPYTDIELQLEPGEAIFLYTDGVTEAMNSAQELYGEERLLGEIEARRNQPIEKTISDIYALLKQHAGQVPQSDDITMLMLRYEANSAAT